MLLVPAARRWPAVTRAAVPEGIAPTGALAAAWRIRGALLRQHGAMEAAATLETVAGELEMSLRAEADTALTLTEAARESGLSADHLRHLVAAGTVPNAGRHGAPRVRRQDLPTKARAPRGGRYDAYADATSVRRASGMPPV
jgi:hypothetical protein